MKTGDRFDSISPVDYRYWDEDVAKHLSLAEGTVKHHISNVFDKLGVSNRAELAAYAASHGLAEPPPPRKPGSGH